jgi:hypothetical protein
MEPWSVELLEGAAEKEEAPEPCAFPTALKCMEMSVEEEGGACFSDRHSWF